jgi:DNA-binding HxlR family transcriptional regulator
MTQTYGQFCPIAMAVDFLCTRWTLLIIRELACGTTRFNDLRRGLSRISPALLSQRLKDLEAAGIVERKPAPREPNISEYHLTQSGHELWPVIYGLGEWGQRWIETETTLQKLDAQLLMWDMRRHLNPEPMPKTRSIILFQYPEQAPALRSWWMVVTPGEDVDLCQIDPGHDVDLYVSSDLRTMTAIWMGYETVHQARTAQRLHLTGDKGLAANMQTWLGLSSLANVERIAS